MPERKKILLTVTTYPQPSKSYDELVCTGGFLENGEWIRIYPVPLSFLIDLKKDGILKTNKYTWIELDLEKRSLDFRPESYSPSDYNFKDIKFLDSLDTKSNWLKRKEICLKKVYTSLDQLINDSKDPINTSMATFKPTKILEFAVEKDERDWKDVWLHLRKQTDMFQNPDLNEQKIIPKLPYKFYYRFQDDVGKVSRLMIEDWEIGQLFWNCLKRAGGNEEEALAKVRQKYYDTFLLKNDIYLFLGTTLEWHRRRSNNPFLIIGVFYPRKDDQIDLFQ